MSGWQDISTAPKDGTNVDVWFANCGRVSDAYFRDGRWLKIKEWRRNGRSRSWFPVSTWRADAHPTHWMPLPAAPEA